MSIHLCKYLFKTNRDAGTLELNENKADFFESPTGKQSHDIYLLGI